MSEANSFTDLIRRVRQGDEQAVAELVRKYEPAIRREVRLRLSDPRLFRLFDSMDIVQSVLGSFFVRAAAGQYDLDSPGQLGKLLVAMTRHKLAFQVRQQRAQRRDHRRVAEGSFHQENLVAQQDSPSQLVAGRELLAEFRNRLSEEERQLADLRAQGQEWAAIAAVMGGTAEARRKQLIRAVDRVAHELGLDDMDNA
jgi:RNA polymerase sigma-70 factor (ECF subfamily)